MQPYLCCSSNHRGGSRSGFCGSRCLLSWSGCSGSLSRRNLQRSQGSRLIDHGRVLIDFSGSRHFVLGLDLEEVTDASRDASANLGSPLLFFDLPYLCQ